MELGVKEPKKAKDSPRRKVKESKSQIMEEQNDQRAQGSEVRKSKNQRAKGAETQIISRQDGDKPKEPEEPRARSLKKNEARETKGQDSKSRSTE